VNTWNFYYF